MQKGKFHKFLGMEHRKNKSKDAATFDDMLAGGGEQRDPPRHRHAH
jgi:hypothetical protein